MTHYIVIDKTGRVIKTTLLKLHDDICQLLRKEKDDEFGWHLGNYLVRAWPLVKLLDMSHCRNILDVFGASCAIQVNLKDLINWISLAREYINDIELEQQQTISCTHCESGIYEHADGEYCCDNCGFVYDTRIPGIKDLESINMCKTYYSLNSNLLSAIDKFEGKDIVIGKSDMKKIKSEISRRQLDINTIKCDHIVKILKDLKLTKHYNDAYYIYSQLTNKPPINIRKYVPQILMLHNELEFAYKFVKNDSRVNSLNVQYKLIKLLGLCNIDHDVSEFCTLKTEQKLEEHEEKWREICKITGWVYK
jgi:hypothetical protein